MVKLFEVEKEINQINTRKIIGNGMIFDNKKMVANWKGDIESIIIYDCLEDLLKVSDGCGFKIHNLIKYGVFLDKVRMFNLLDKKYEKCYEENQKLKLILEDNQVEYNLIKTQEDINKSNKKYLKESGAKEIKLKKVNEEEKEIISLVIRYSCEDRHPPDGECVCTTIAHEIFESKLQMKKFLLNKYIEIVKENLDNYCDDCNENEKENYLAIRSCSLKKGDILLDNDVLNINSSIVEFENNYDNLYDDEDITVYFDIKNDKLEKELRNKK